MTYYYFTTPNGGPLVRKNGASGVWYEVFIREADEWQQVNEEQLRYDRYWPLTALKLEETYDDYDDQD